MLFRLTFGVTLFLLVATAPVLRAQTDPPDQGASAEVAASGTSQQPQGPQDPGQPSPDQHPEPAHTGISALVRATAADFAAFPQRKSTWVFVALGGGLALATHPADHDLNGRISGSRAVGRFFAPGKWVGSVWVQGGTAAGLYIVGRYVLPPAEGTPRTNKVSHLGYDLLRAQIVSQAVVQGIKRSARRDRPTGECCSFPSGHAATAFAVASVLERHFGYRAAWPTLAVATYVAVSRLHDNRHFLSDVVFGSAVGMSTGWTVVGRHGRSSYALMPMPIPGGVGFMLTYYRQRPAVS
jgi:membrane-associated phospholipid phosphatase